MEIHLSTLVRSIILVNQKFFVILKWRLPYESWTNGSRIQSVPVALFGDPRPVASSSVALLAIVEVVLFHVLDAGTAVVAHGIDRNSSLFRSQKI